MSREVAETEIRQQIEWAWGPYVNRGSVNVNALSRRLRSAMEETLAEQAVEAGLVILQKHIEAGSIDIEELEEAASESVKKQVDWVSASIAETSGNLVDNENEDYVFSMERAARIAITEVTRARSQGEDVAKEILAELDIPMVATWLTAADERVCEICGPLDHKLEIVWRKEFPLGPPAHPNCRCSLLWSEAEKKPKRRKPVKRTRGVSRLRNRSKPEPKPELTGSTVGRFRIRNTAKSAKNAGNS